MSCFFKKYFFIFALFVVLVSFGSAALAQKQGQSKRFFEAQFRPTDATTMVSGKVSVQLWGVQNIEGMPAQFNASARGALDSALGAKKVRCELKKRTEGYIIAQCTNSADLDLGLYMLQQGYATVDRGAVYGTVFEESYIQAEMEAQSQGLGVWASGSSGDSRERGGYFVLVLGSILLLIVLGVFSVLATTIMKGFQRVIDAQNRNMDMISRERELRNKEREIFATMLDSEIKVNKSKIEAYLAVYDEMLKDLQNSDGMPKYKKAGDIVQVQPALDRSVFDRNTEKLDILGNRLSSQVIHFYARIKSKPDFINLDPDTPVEDATEIVRKAYNNAERLDKISNRLIDAFAEGGHSSEEVY